MPRKKKTAFQKFVAFVTGEDKAALQYTLQKKMLLDTLIDLENDMDARDADPSNPFLQDLDIVSADEIDNLSRTTQSVYKKWIHYALNAGFKKQTFDIGDDMRARLERVTKRLIEDAEDGSIDASSLYHIAEAAPNVAALYRQHAEKMWNIGPYDASDMDYQTPDHIAEQWVLSSGGQYYFGPRAGYDNIYSDHVYPQASVNKDGDLVVLFADFGGNARDIGDLDDHLSNPVTAEEKLARDRELRRLAIFVHTAAHIFDEKMAPDARTADLPHPYL